MKSVKYLVFALWALSMSVATFAVGLADLNPDDVMLRRPSGRAPSLEQKRQAQQRAAAERAVAEKAAAERAAAEKAAAERAAAEKAAAERVAAEKAAAERIAEEQKRAAARAAEERIAAAQAAQREAEAKVELERRVAEQVKARAEAARLEANQAIATAAAERQAAAEAAEKADAERQAAIQAAARAETERLASVEAVAKAEDARKAAAEKAAQAEAARVAEAERTAAELKALREQIAAEKAARAKAEAAKAEAEAAMGEVVQKARDAKEARVRAEAAASAAEARAEAEKAAATRAVEAQAVAERKIARMQNPEPDEKPVPRKLVAPADQGDVLEAEKSSSEGAHKVAEKKPLTGRDAIITAERMDYDHKAGVVLFDRNVFVDDEQYQMHADRLFVFLETNAVNAATGKSEKKKERKSEGTGGLSPFGGGGSSSLQRLVAFGHVSITNENRSAYCARAVFSKKVGKIVMYGDDEITPWILDPSQSPTPQRGEKITFWTISSQVEVERPVFSTKAFGKSGGSPLKMLK